MRLPKSKIGIFVFGFTTGIVLTSIVDEIRMVKIKTSIRDIEDKISLLL